jgi:hypothetical protein
MVNRFRQAPSPLQPSAFSGPRSAIEPDDSASSLRGQDS